ncbi:MAG: hypothetical protein SV775_02115, partial [Thermodesulfobacteriota bacterium]|nr:hypothetical protein [Thermodesulfobacteriota bacterium]
RKKHFFPELPDPVISDSLGRVALELRSKHITLSQSFVEEAAKHLPVEEVIEALLDHGVAHYTYCPWDFHTHLSLYQEAKKVLADKELARKSTDCFMDVVADTHCFREKDTPIPDLYRHMERGILEEAIHALYQRIWGTDLNVRGNEEISRRLSRIFYLDRRRWSDSIHRFSIIIQPLLELDRQFSSSENSNSMGENNFGNYSYEEVDQGLKEFAMSSGGPGEFKEVVEDFKDELKEMGYEGHGKIGLGIGASVDADVLYYMKIAENYSLPIRKTTVEKSGFLYPFGHSPWELGKPFRDIDPWTSFGKVMPGITQVWERKDGDFCGEDEGTPNCIIMIDSSGSMTNPSQQLSYAVLGAACASDAYLSNDASVAVFNFSDANANSQRILDYTRDRTEIYNTICHYFGGGTKLDFKDIESLQGPSRPDIFIITDMLITNLDALISYFNGLDNRVTAVHTGENERVRQFKKSLGDRKNVSIYSVQEKKDIPRIVLGKITEYFGSAS